MDAIRQTPVGVDVESWATGWQIAGVHVDNPTGSWLYLSGIGAYVPPYRNGWAQPIHPTQASISIRFVDSPSGSRSELVGDPVVIRVSDTPYPATEGFTSGSGSKVSTIPPLLTATAPIATGAGSSLISMVSNPGQRIVVRRIEVVPDLTAGMAGIEPFRSLITVLFQLQGGGSGTPEWYLSISPESPFAEAVFEDGAFKLPIGVSLEVIGYAESGSAKAFFVAMAQYYLENQ